MSSHHFVKEGQEPALIILNKANFRHVQDLLEWSPLVFTVDTVLEEVLSWGIKIDAVFGVHGNEKNLSEKLADQHPVTILSYSREETPINTCFHYLIRNKKKM